MGILLSKKKMTVCNAIVVSVNLRELKVALETRTSTPREIAECILNPKFPIPKTLLHPSTLNPKSRLVNLKGISVFTEFIQQMQVKGVQSGENHTSEELEFSSESQEASGRDTPSIISKSKTLFISG
ncbi:hypothetical protein YC2023_022564 [Brassica napus]